MTLAPLVNPTIHGIMGKPVDLPSGCAAPGCGRPAQQRHHLWPKSFLRGQPFEWVSVNGVILPNSIGLCLGHHVEVTGDVGGHVAKVVYDERVQVFEWWEVLPDNDWRFVGRVNSDDFLHETEASRQRKKEGLCPTCGKPHTSHATKPRKTKTWTVNVPADAEDGAAVLDEYVDDLSVVLGYGDEGKGVRRYHVLANVLAWVMTVKPEFISDWEEAGYDAGVRAAPGLSAEGDGAQRGVEEDRGQPPLGTELRPQGEGRLEGEGEATPARAQGDDGEPGSVEAPSHDYAGGER